MALLNPTKLINVQELSYFEGKLAAKYQTQTISVDGFTATTVTDALAELKTAIGALPSAIVPKGTKTFAGLVPSTDLVAANVGSMWNISDGFTTTADFVEGAGHVIPAGANVYVANPSEDVYKYDIFAGMYDLSGFKTAQTAVADADATTEGTGIVFVAAVTQNTNGEITVHKKTVQDAVASENGVGGNAGLMSAADKEKLNGLAPSGYKTVQTAVTDPTAGSAPALEFIATIAQDANGEITVTKQAVAVAADADIDSIFA